MISKTCSFLFDPYNSNIICLLLPLTKLPSNDCYMYTKLLHFPTFLGFLWPHPMNHRLGFTQIWLLYLLHRIHNWDNVNLFSWKISISKNHYWFKLPSFKVPSFQCFYVKHIRILNVWMSNCGMISMKLTQPLCLF